MSCGLGCRCGLDLVLAVVKAGSYSSDSTPSLGTSICGRCRPKKKKKKKLGRKPLQEFPLWLNVSAATGHRFNPCLPWYIGLENLVLLQLLCSSQRQPESDPWPRNSIRCGAAKKKERNKKEHCRQRIRNRGLTAFQDGNWQWEDPLGPFMP